MDFLRGIPQQKSLPGQNLEDLLVSVFPLPEEWRGGRGSNPRHPA